ncbi:MAG: serine/threonine protein kinase [Myxococcales bacterium]|nr:MAG: serine/threonine protein kinase [Myxococcales bacterium]
MAHSRGRQRHSDLRGDRHTGRVIAGRYSLEREIGRGGAGVVWLGKDAVLGRQVAIKEIGRMPGATTADRERAEREAQLSARLNHPNIVGVHDFVTDADSGEHWLVMEYVEGPTLTQRVRERGPLPSQEAGAITRQLADALAAAHGAGITHRDVKPSNVILDQGRVPKLTDFGIARTLADPALTQTGLLSGSPAYLAPEVASGQRGDHAADVWSLGATLFQMLSGRPPYDFGENVMGGLFRIVNDDPPRLAEAGVLAPVLEHTMAKDPDQRWTAARVRDELAAISGISQEVTQPVPLSPTHSAAPDPTRALTLPPTPTPPPPAAGPEARRDRPPWLVPALIALAAVVLIALGASLFNGGDEGQPAQPSTSVTPTPSPAASSSTTPRPTPQQSVATSGTQQNGKSAKNKAKKNKAKKNKAKKNKAKGKTKGKGKGK